MSDEQIEELENQFLRASGAAFATARQQALAAGQAVLQTENGQLVKLHPDGRREFLKQLEPPLKVKAGTTIEIR